MKKKLKVALVKNDWSMFYRNVDNKDILKTIYSSEGHSPFLGLLVHHDTTIITISDKTIQKLITIEGNYLVPSKARKKMFKTISGSSQKTALSSTIDWNSFDIVVAIDACVPRKTIKQYPRVLWSTALNLPSYSYHLFNKVFPVFSYNLTLVDGLSLQTSIGKMQKENYLRHKKGKILVPLSFSKSGDIANLFPKLKKTKNIHVEPHCASILTAEEKKQLEKLGSLSYRLPKQEYLKILVKSRFFIVPKKKIRLLKGHSLIEANAANCFVIVKKGTVIDHSQMLGEENYVDDFDELLKKIIEYNKNPNRLKKDLARQQSRFDKFCFYNPSSQLYEMLEYHQKSWQKKSHFTSRFLDYFLSHIYIFHWIIFIPIYRFCFFISEKLFKKDLSLVISSFFKLMRKLNLR